MKTLKSGILGVMAAVLSGFIVLNILSFGLVEDLLSMPQDSTHQPTLPLPNLTPILVIQVTTTPFLTETIPPAPTQCPQPAGWHPYQVQPGDTLANLAEIHGISLELLMTKNCLISSQILSDTWIFLPVMQTAMVTKLPHFTSTHQPSPSSTAAACQPPQGWIRYTVRPGDTLTRISVLYRVTIWELKQANCLVSDIIQAGMQLWVPNVATSTLTASPSPTAEVIKTTRVPTFPSTFTPTETVLPTSTFTSTPTTTDTPAPTSTFTPTPLPTSTPTDTPIPSPTSTDTPTAGVMEQ